MRGVLFNTYLINFFIFIVYSSSFAQRYISHEEEQWIEVADAATLYRIGSSAFPLNGKYLQTQNIDVSEYSSGEGWRRIGDTGIFNGIFDGQGYTISNLTINNDGTYQGLFRTIGPEGVLRHMRLSSVQITNTKHYVGALAGRNDGLIFDCAVLDGELSVNNYAGGLVGQNRTGTIEQCYSGVNISGETHLGGLVGSNYSSGVIIDSYSDSKVSGSSSIGGLVGTNYNSIVTNSYSSGEVSWSSSGGGLLGENIGRVEHSYWNIETSNQTESFGEEEGKTNQEMMQASTFINWDFDEVWDIRNDETMPYLRLLGENDIIKETPFLTVSLNDTLIDEGSSRNAIYGDILNSVITSTSDGDLSNLIIESGDSDLLEIIESSDSDLIGQALLLEIKVLKTGITTLKIIQPATEYYESKEFHFDIIAGKKKLVVTPIDGQQKVYGEDDPEELQFTVLGLLDEDDRSVFSGELKRFEGENVGKYAIQTHSLRAGDHYDIDLDADTVYFKISPREIIISIDNIEKVYGDIDPKLSFEVSGIESLEVPFEGALQREDGENAGFYVISEGSLSAGFNYTLVFEKSGRFTIHKAASEIIAEPIQMHTYDGTARAIIANLNHDEAELTFEPQQSFVNAGTYQINIHIPETTNYTDADSTVTLIINKAIQEGLFLEDADYIYDGEVRNLTVSGITDAIKDELEIIYNNNGNGYRNAGTYKVTATVIRSNYEDLVLSANLTIHKAASEIIAESIQVHTYDGKAKTIIAHLNHEEAELTFEPHLSFVNAGTYQIKISAPETTNYLQTESTVTLTINKAIQEGLSLANASYVYNGEVRHLALSDVSSDIEHELIILYDNNGHKNAGSYEVTATVSRTNFEDLVLSAKLTITKAEATIHADAIQIHTYDGKPKTIIAHLNHEEAELTFEPRSSFVDAGTFQIKVSSPETTNYLETESTVILTINKALQEGLSLADANYVYSGDIRHLTLSGISPDIEHELTVLYKNNEHKNAGIYKVTATISRPNFEDLVLSAKLTISKAEATIHAEAIQVYTYDGKSKTIITQLNHEETDLIFEPRSSFISAGTYQIKVSSPETTNYFETESTVTLTINKAESNIHAEPIQIHTYDGTEKTIIAHLNHEEAELTFEPHLSFVDAGTYQIKVSSPETTSYLETESTVILTINKALQEGLSLADANYVYSGDIRHLTLSGVSPDIEHELTILYENNGHKNAGTYKVTATVSRPNFEDLVSSAKLTISKAESTITADPIQIHTYDGTEKEVLVHLNHEEAELTFESFITAGTYKIDVHSQETKNFLSGQTEVTLIIEKAILVVIPNNTTRQFNTPNPLFTMSYHGFKNNEDESVLLKAPTGNTLANLTSGIGEYLITPSGAVASNYNFKYMDGLLTITPATLEGISFEDATFIYNNQRQSISVKNLPKTASVSYENNDHINTGRYEVRATIDKFGFTSQTLQATMTIKKAPQTIHFKEIGSVSRDVHRIELDVASSMGLPVQLSSDDPLVASLDGYNLLIHRLGTLRITARQEGDANHGAAAPVTILVRVEDETEGPVRVHQALSPNGDGINDFLILEGIKEFPENRLKIISRTGLLVFDVQGYDNERNVFKGISNTRASQSTLPDGTYLYTLQYKNNGSWQSKKGWIVLKRE